MSDDFKLDDTKYLSHIHYKYSVTELTVGDNIFKVGEVVDIELDGIFDSACCIGWVKSISINEDNLSHDDGVVREIARIYCNNDEVLGIDSDGKIKFYLQ